MSYILDSLKKSDKERRSIDKPAAMVMSAPAFLANDKPRTNYRWLIVMSSAVALLAVIYFSISHFKIFSFSNYLSDVTETISSAPTAKTILSKEKEEAILLYRQALSTKSQPEIDSLYKELNEKKLALASIQTVDSQAITVSNKTNIGVGLVSTSSSDVTAAIAASQLSVSDSQSIETTSIEAVATPTSISKEQKIPSIYELDAYFRKDIPSVNYGAHIYATDNNSGFVILDGARRRVGDQLDSGLFIEKIEEESVVLSFNGTLFSLPAMKSWEGK